MYTPHPQAVTLYLLHIWCMHTRTQTNHTECEPHTHILVPYFVVILSPHNTIASNSPETTYNTGKITEIDLGLRNLDWFSYFTRNTAIHKITRNVFSLCPILEQFRDRLLFELKLRPSHLVWTIRTLEVLAKSWFSFCSFDFVCFFFFSIMFHFQTDEYFMNSL